MYAGGYERNFPTLTPESTTFAGTDGLQHDHGHWPDGVDGLRVSFMEKAGKKLVAVRVADGVSDVVLANAMILIPGEHFGFSVRLGAAPVTFEDDSAALKMLEDIIKKNADASGELLQMRKRFKERAGIH